MATTWQDRVQPIVADVLETHAVPGIVIAVAEGEKPPEVLVMGEDAAGRPLAPESLFPLASITKLATALALLRLVDAGHLTVDDDLATTLPEAAAAQPGVTLRRLLTHTAGLPFDLPKDAVPDAPGIGWPEIAQAYLQVPLDRAPGTRVNYSNVGYGLLGLVIERVAGQPWPVALNRLVLEPLGVEAYLGVEPPRAPARLSDIDDPSAGTPQETFNSPHWRSRALPAGRLVTTAIGSLAFVRAFRGQPAGFLRPTILAAATQDQTGGLGGGVSGWQEWPVCPWGLGPALRDSMQGFWRPDTLSSASFGHTGASGCIAWADPVADMAWSIHATRIGTSGWAGQAFPVIQSSLLGAEA